MNILALDIGGKTRNGFCLMNTTSKEVYKCSYIVYDNKQTPLYHRMKILKEIRQEYLDKFQVDGIIFERINLFRGQGVSPLANIVSLCKLQTTLIDNLSDTLPIYDVAVRSWKAVSLDNGAKSTKEDSINKVTELYPDIDLKVPKYTCKKNLTAYEYNHDLADAICIALAVSMKPELLDNKVNYR